MSHESVDAMMLDFASAAVEMAHELGVSLDFSEESIQRVEQILSQLHTEIRDTRIAQAANAVMHGSADAPSANEPGPSPDQMDDMCKLWGSYLGEVVRRRWGGEWSVENYPGAKFATLALTVSAGKLFPSIKVFRRLTEGDEENVWSFYQSVRARLSQQPGAAVQ